MTPFLLSSCPHLDSTCIGPEVADGRRLRTAAARASTHPRVSFPRKLSHSLEATNDSIRGYTQNFWHDLLHLRRTLSGTIVLFFSSIFGSKNLRLSTPHHGRRYNGKTQWKSAHPNLNSKCASGFHLKRQSTSGHRALRSEMGLPLYITSNGCYIVDLFSSVLIEHFQQCHIGHNRRSLTSNSRILWNWCDIATTPQNLRELGFLWMTRISGMRVGWMRTGFSQCLNFISKSTSAVLPTTISAFGKSDLKCKSWSTLYERALTWFTCRNRSFRLFNLHRKRDSPRFLPHVSPHVSKC